ncbi:hypothetical protein G4B88_013301 [Cannabis sativa]|uniref:Uncharacterized protein n=1 Tax=Cannabis sativa TaxID=3483 RepID=A0A7J6DK54_CANSA|nr:hypothetical protein G4B88_013301 [Cannabis sativa]
MISETEGDSERRIKVVVPNDCRERRNKEKWRGEGHGDCKEMERGSYIMLVVLEVSSLQHKLLIKITLAESDLLDCSNSTISFKNFNLFNCLRSDFRDEIVSIKDKGLEKPSWSN